MIKTVAGNQTHKIWMSWNITTLLLVVMLMIRCTSTHTTQNSYDEYYPTEPLQAEKQYTEPVVQHETHNFAQGNFPLGIGTKFNLAMAENPKEESSASNLYDNYIQPLRRGKILSRTPVEMNYSIMPDKGEAFFHPGGLDTGSIKSSYSFQVGMSRHVYEVSDFLSADFWLAKGKYNPNKKRYTYRNDEPQLNPFSDPVEDDDSFLSEPYIPEYTGTVLLPEFSSVPTE